MLVVANFHYIRETFQSDYPSIFGVTPRQFKNQLDVLCEIGEFVSADSLISGKAIKKDAIQFMITFDDGLKEQYEMAAPILNQLGIPFVFFVNTINTSEKQISLVHQIHLLRSRISSTELLNNLPVDKISLTTSDKELAVVNYAYDDPDTAYLKFILNFKMSIDEQGAVVNKLFTQYFDVEKVHAQLYMTPDQIIELNNQGYIGSHGHQHIPYGLYPASFIHKEFERSQEIFKADLGGGVATISYPYGSFEASLNTEAAARQNGFKLGFSMERAINENLDSPYMLGRFDCNDLPGGKSPFLHNKNDILKTVSSQWYR
ncbi:MAG: polysaccharide deacetylase family protein [Nonlabens sp.]